MKKYLYQKIADFIIYAFDLFEDMYILEELYVTGLTLDTAAQVDGIELT